MGALTCNINGQAFGGLSSSSGRKCIFCKPAFPLDLKSRFHVPGTNGNYIIYEGQSGGVIVARVRYIDTKSNVEANYQTDLAAWRNTPITVVDDQGKSYDRCNLEGFERVSEPIGVGGSSNRMMFDAQAVFAWDGF